MRYLVIGDSNSMHIYNFVKTVLLPMDYEVHLLTLSTRPLRAEYMDFYRKNNVFVHSVYEKKYTDLNKKDKIHRVKNFVRKFKLMKDVPYVDICHVQSVYKTSLLILLLNRRKFKKLILSYWGGDIEDKSKFVINLRKKCFKFADAITVTVKETYKEFQEVYGCEFDDKLSICRFATDGLNCIYSLKNRVTRFECRKEYGIPEGKICITCGYSAYEEQRQDVCLRIIKSLDTVKDNIYVIVPMQYGRYNQEYIERVESIAHTCDFPVLILDTYVPFEKSAMLAIATDIYLHLRTTDAFSNALKEHIYAKSRVIKGDWLKYPELDEMGVNVKSISGFDQLADALIEECAMISPTNKVEVFEPIYELYSTEAIVNQWVGIIKKVDDRFKDADRRNNGRYKTN